jgi:biopolymer transport protein ExbD
MRRKRSGRAGEHSQFDEPEGSVAPLIDVSFLLLIFFLVATTLLKEEQDLTTRLGWPGPPSDQPPLPVVVDVRASGEIALNPGVGETLVSMDANDRELDVLREHLEAMVVVTGGDKMVVQLRAEDDAAQQRVVDVLNCFAGVGVGTVGFVDTP